MYRGMSARIQGSDAEEREQRERRRIEAIKEQVINRQHERLKRKKIEEYERKRREELKSKNYTRRSLSRSRSRSKSRTSNDLKRDRTQASTSKPEIMSQKFESLSNTPLLKGPSGTKINMTELSRIKVDIYRNLTVAKPTNEIQREILNPEDVQLKRRQGEGSKPIFEREELKKSEVPTSDVVEHHIVVRLGGDRTEKRQHSRKRSRMECEVDGRSMRRIETQHGRDSTWGGGDSDSTSDRSTESSDSTAMSKPSTSFTTAQATATAQGSDVRVSPINAQVDHPCNQNRTELITQALLKMIVADKLPFSIVTGDGFRDFMAVVEPNFKVMCVETLKNQLMIVYKQMAEIIAAELSAVPVVALTSNYWGRPSEGPYITVTTHFLSPRWIPKSITLATEECQPTDDQDDAVILTEKIEAVMNNWKLDGKVTAVVTNDAEIVKDSVRAHDHILIYNGVTCAVHSLQLCIMKALNLDMASVFCDKASKVVGHFHHSEIATMALKQNQEKLGLPKLELIQRRSWRWDSTYAMIDRLLKNRSPVTKVLSDRGITTKAAAEQLAISSHMWSTLENLQIILKPLQIATTVLCADTHVPISVVRPIIYSLRDNHLRESRADDEGIKLFKTTLRDEITARFDLEYDPVVGVNARQIASFIDPRYKNLMFESPEARGAIISSVKNQLSSDTDMEEAQEKNQETAMDFLIQVAPALNGANAQFEMYLTEPQICHNMDPFEWWANHEKQYPALADLARNYLCIPATSQSLKKVCSIPVSPKGSRLDHENLNLMIFLHENR